MEKTGADWLIFHFQSQKILLLGRDGTQEAVVSEPVQKGGMLVSLPPECPDGSITLVAGDNCELSANEKSVLATVGGYPHWQIDEEQGCVVTVEPMVKISPDKMTAEVTLYPDVTGKGKVLADIFATITAAGVRFGLKEQAIKDAMLAVEDGDKKAVTFEAAKGNAAQHGEEAYTRIELEMGLTVGEMQEDGSLDFKERRMFVYVDEGQLIATIIAATPGLPGKNVLGGTIEPKPGRDITVRVMEDAVFDAGRNVVVAGKAGIVSVVNDTTFKVSSKQTISGDIDYATGNLYAKNNVDITGSVKPDFVVSVRGDVRIGEHIQSATVNSQGNLVVNGGVMGEKAQLNIRGDADLKFIERGTIYAGGHIVLRNNAYYSRMEAGGDILGGASSKIVGGRVVCGGQLCVADIGSESAESAFVAVGVDAKRLITFEQLHDRAAEIEEKLDRFFLRHGTEAEKPQKIIDLGEELATIRQRLNSFNLIKGSPEDSHGQEEYGECLADLVVTGTIVAGTKIRIGNLTKTLDKSLVKKRFRVDNLFKAIVAENL